VDYTSGIVRILSPDGNTSGSGFVVSRDGLIATCAHVLIGADNRGQRGAEEVTLAFNGNDTPRTARIIENYWRPPGAEDVAILRLEGPLPNGIDVLPLGSSAGTAGHRFVTFGFPNVPPIRGIHGSGVIVGLTKDRAGNSLLQAREATDITLGHSGAPVWDLSKSRVVGMVYSIIYPDEASRLGGTAFFIPSETLEAVCGELEIRGDDSPYRGLAFFTEEDHEIFFGRSQDVERLKEKLRTQPRLLTLTGPSGSGKSSLVRAGLIPELRCGTIPGSERWLIITTRPAEKPLDMLEELGFVGAKENLAAALTTWLSENPQWTRILLIVDQFEEVFGTGLEAAREDLLAQLASILEGTPAITVILVLRDEFLADFSREAGTLLDASQSVTVSGSLRREDLIAIIEKPALNSGSNLESGLVDRLVNDAIAATLADDRERSSARITILPLLEFTLDGLWRRREEGTLTHKAYDKIGGLTGGLTHWANRTLEELGKESSAYVDLAKRIFIELVHVGEENQIVKFARRRRALINLYRDPSEERDVRKVVDWLTKERLLVPGPPGSDSVEIIHEALIWNWDEFQKRLASDFKFLSWRQEIRGSVARWIASDPRNPERRDSDNLLRGRGLTEAVNWLDERRSDFGKDELEFVLSSRNLASRRQRTKRIGLALAIAAVSIFSCVIVYLWRAAEVQRKKADERTRLANDQRRIALSRQLAAQALTKIGRELDLAMLLALESHRIQPTHEAIQSLGEALCKSFRLERSLTPPASGDVAISPGGRRLAVSLSDWRIGIWDLSAEPAQMSCILQRNPLAATLERKALSGELATLAFSPDEKTLAWIDEHELHIWDLETPQRITTVPIRGSSHDIHFNPKGSLVLVTSSGGEGKNFRRLTIWTAPSLRLIFDSTNQEATFQPESATFHPNGEKFAAVDQHGEIRISSASSGELIKRIPAIKGSSSSHWIRGLEYSSDGKYLFYMRGHSMCLVDAESGMEQEDLLTVRLKRIVEAHLTDTGGRLICFDSEGRGYFCDTSGREPIRGPRWVTNGSRFGSSHGIRFSRKRGFVAAPNWKDRSIRIWDISAANALVTELAAPDFSLQKLYMCPDGKTIISIRHPEIARWDIQARNRVGDFHMGRAPHYSEVSSDCGKMAVAYTRARSLSRNVSVF